MSLKWIAIRSKPRSEKIVSNELNKKGIESFLPLIKKRQQWSDRKKFKSNIPNISISIILSPHIEKN